MQQQFETGNLKKTNPNFPVIINSIQSMNTESTILNNGPDKSILETIDKICEKIKNYHFDVAVISVGAYSLLLSDFIIHKLNKKVFVCGGTLPAYFGIITMRTKHHKPQLINEFFITVPEEFKPKGYEK